MADTIRPETPHISERYRLVQRVASGGMAEIWRADDLHTDDVVAVKRLLSVESSTADYRRLLREGEALRSMSHPNIVRYLDVGLDAGDHPFIVLEWLEGEDLAARRARMALELPEALELVRQALAGLACAHQQQIIHRDISPKNLFLQRLESGETRVKLLDFGLARYAQSVMTILTRAGTSMGTLNYMAPEQLKGRSGEGTVEQDRRVDLYAMGAILYELATGRPPFVAAEPAVAMLKIISETPPWPTELQPEPPAWLEDVIMRAIRRSPADRFPSAEEMLAALEGPGASAPVPEALDRADPGPVSRAPQLPEETTEDPTPAPEQHHPHHNSGRPRSPGGPVVRTLGGTTERPGVLFGGWFRQWPRMRVVVGICLALGLSSLVPTGHASRMQQERLVPLRQELAQALELESRPPASRRRPQGKRGSRAIRQAIADVCRRQFLITLAIWVGCFLMLALLWFRFC